MLRPDSIESLAALWQSLLIADSPDVSQPKLRRIARSVAAEARSNGVRAEQLLIEVKKSWATHHERVTFRDVDSWSDRRLRAERVVSELVTLLIEEYYDGSAATPPADASPP